MEFGILGPLVVVTEDGERQVGSAKARSVLGLLVVRANQVVSTETLIDAVWDEDPPRSAVTTLQTYVYQLRKSLELDSIRTRPTGYTLEVPRAAVDALRFEDAVRSVIGAHDTEPGEVARILSGALQSWRGRALADFEASAWARPEIARLETLRLDAIEKLIDARLVLGDHLAVIPELEALVAEHPLRERFWASLMLALYRSDRQSDALRAYSRLRRHLRDELGLEPHRELSELEAAILAHRPELELPARSETEPGDRQGTPVARPRRRVLLAFVLAVIVVATAGAALARSMSKTSHAAVPLPGGYTPRYRTVACPTQIRVGDSSVRCGVLTVPENRARPRGRTIDLGVFRYPTRVARPAGDPVVQVGSDFHLSEPPADTALRGRSDSIYLAGRGFFGSNPHLTCPEISTAVIASLARPLRDPANTVSFVRAAESCRARWTSRGVDLSAYSAAERADDVRDLALVLRLHQIDLLAGGPTTGDAREIAGRYPSLVRSITLFNVTPPDSNRWNGAITNATGALDRFFGECSNQPECIAAYPHLRRQLTAQYKRDEAAAQQFTTSNPYRAAHKRVRVLIDGDRAMELALLALDDPGALPLVPAAIASPTSGQAVAEYAAQSLIAPDDASWGALLSRVCIDDIGTLSQAGLSVEAQAEPQLAFLAEDPLLDACAVWNVKSAQSRAPGPAGTPTLILEGELDPFTSRDWAAQAAQTFGRATVVQLPHLGRVAWSSDPCVGRLRARFLADPLGHIVEGECARDIAPLRLAGT